MIPSKRAKTAVFDLFPGTGVGGPPEVRDGGGWVLGVPDEEDGGRVGPWPRTGSSEISHCCHVAGRRALREIGGEAITREVPPVGLL